MTKGCLSFVPGRSIARGDYAAAEKVLAPLAAASAGGDAALELGLLQLYLGRRSEGRRAMQLVLMAEPRSPGARDYARAGRAARALGQFQEANGYYRDAIGLAPADALIDTHWGDLFLEKHQWGEAAKSFQAALKNQPDYGPAHLGLARAVVQDNPPVAEKAARRALELNPADVGAHLFLAELAVMEDKKDEARAAIAKAQAINPHSLEAHALNAAVNFVEGKDAEYKAAVDAALKINALYGEAFRVVGEVTARYYRFEEAAEQTRRAIAIDRENARAQADLGAQLMRTGDERNARRALETSFRVDPYDRDYLQLARTARPVSITSRPSPRATSSSSCIPMKSGSCASTFRRSHATRSTHSASDGTSRRKDQSWSRCFHVTTTSPCARSGCPA